MKWSKKQQLLLLKRTCYHKPIGKHRNKELDIIIGEFKERFPELDVKKQDLIDPYGKTAHYMLKIYNVWHASAAFVLAHKLLPHLLPSLLLMLLQQLW